MDERERKKQEEYTIKGADTAGTTDDMIHLEKSNIELWCWIYPPCKEVKPPFFIGEKEHWNTWISEETWRLVDERVTMGRKSRARMGMRRLGRAIQASLKGDRRRRVEEVGSAVEALLKEDPPNANEAWRRMKG